MPYDPKRPRPVVDDDAPAPVEALITTELPVVEPSAPAVEADPVVIEPEPEPEPVTVEPEPEPVAVEPKPEPEPEPATRPVEAAAPVTGSDVPLAPAPDTPTANRAVAVTSLIAAILSALVLVWLWRRRR